VQILLLVVFVVGFATGLLTSSHTRRFWDLEDLRGGIPPAGGVRSR